MKKLTRAELLRYLREALTRLEKSAADARDQADAADLLFVQEVRRGLESEVTSETRFWPDQATPHNYAEPNGLCTGCDRHVRVPAGYLDGGGMCYCPQAGAWVTVLSLYADRPRDPDTGFYPPA